MKTQRGQALITLLFFMIIVLTITSSAIIVTLVNSVGASKIEQAESVYAIAESGIENALLRLLRDPSYTGETVSFATGTAVIEVNSVGNAYTITSQATTGTMVRKVQVNAMYTNNKLALGSWKEIYQ